ncbi:unnamed protein product [Orchesella dallaii]|uniref:Uncharacterized protein n=1 Tax=Orchesella dallaii TaxID=48710 RepID=A0ABP1QVV0_9HEXA
MSRKIIYNNHFYSGRRSRRTTKIQQDTMGGNVSFLCFFILILHHLVICHSASENVKSGTEESAPVAGLPVEEKAPAMGIEADAPASANVDGTEDDSPAGRFLDKLNLDYLGIGNIFKKQPKTKEKKPKKKKKESSEENVEESSTAKPESD